MSTRSKFPNKKVIIVAILAVGAVSAILVASPSSIVQATTQQQQQQQQQEQQKMMSFGKDMPRINGSVSVAGEETGLIIENAKMPFVIAAATAQEQVANGTVLGGHLGVVQGYLVYKFFVADTANEAGHLIVIDAGNGKVLYTSEAQPLGSFDHSMYERWDGRGHAGGGGWHGAGKWHGSGWGVWR